MMEPFECYQKYIALKCHFKDDKYDYFKHSGKVRATIQAFEKRNDKSFFFKIVKKYDDQTLLTLLLANFVEDDATWIGETLSDQAEENYFSWKRRVQSLSYLFEQDLIRLFDKSIEKFGSKNDAFIVRENQHPLLMYMVMSGEVSIETMVVLNDLLDLIPRWNKYITDDIVYPQFRRKVLKYSQFLLQYVEVDKLKGVLKKYVSNS